jgi:hypothetical protein
MSKRRARLGFLIVAPAVLALVASAVAGVPLKMNYQVMLTDAENNPQPGTHSLVFRIFDDESGGAELWSETQTLEANSTGVISAIMGSETPIAVSLPDSCWLEVQVDGEILTPRREFVCSPYAFRAADSDKLGGVDAGSYALDGHDHDAYYVNEDQTDAVTTDMILPDFVGSVDGVSNDGGDIDLVAGPNVSITPDDGSNTITISATLAGGGGDITAVQAGDGLVGGGDSGAVFIAVGGGDGINLTADTVAVDVTELVGAGLDSDGSNNIKIATGGVTADMILPAVVSSLDGVANDGGDIDLVAGSNISITPDDGANTITITSTGGDDGDWTPINGDIYRASGSVGIGLSDPSATLDVSGTARVTGFALPTGAAAGYVLTSDTTGVGTWQAPASGGLTAVIAGDGLVGGGDVGDVTLDIQAGGGLTVVPDEVRIADGGVDYGKLADTLSIGSDWVWELTNAYVDVQISTEGPALWMLNSAGAGDFGDCLWIGSNAFDASSDTDVLLADAYNGRVASFEKFTDDDQYAVRIAGASSGSEGLYVDGTIVSTGGVARGVETTRGKEALFSVEAPEAEIYASGTSRLEDGTAYVALDRLFTEAASARADVRVAVTPVGTWSALYVESKTAEGFRVRSAAGDGSAEFDWVATARARGHETRPPMVFPEMDGGRKKSR